MFNAMLQGKTTLVPHTRQNKSILIITYNYITCYIAYILL